MIAIQILQFVTTNKAIKWKFINYIDWANFIYYNSDSFYYAEIINYFFQIPVINLKLKSQI